MRRKQTEEEDNIEHVCKPEHYNRVCIADFMVESTTESLQEVSRCINSMIKKHKEFADMRSKQATYRALGVS